MSMEPNSRFSGRTTDVIGIVTAVVLGAAATYFLVTSRSNKIDALTEEQQILTERLTHLNELASVFARGEQALSTLPQDLDELDRWLPAELDVQAFYEDLTDKASADELSIARIVPGEELAKEAYVELPVQFEGMAKFDRFHAFLFALTNGERLVKLDRLSIDVGDGHGLIDIDMVVKIYAANQEKTVDGL